MAFFVEQFREDHCGSGGHRRSLSETTEGAFVRAPCESHCDSQSQLFGLDDRFECHADDRRKRVRSAMSGHGVLKSRDRVVPSEVPHLPISDSQRGRQRGAPSIQLVTAFDDRERRAHRGTVLALQHEQHGPENLGNFPRSRRNRLSGARHLLFELRDGRQRILDTQLDQATPGAREESAWGKSRVLRFERPEFRVWPGIQIPARGAPPAKVPVQGSGIVLPDNCER